MAPSGTMDDDGTEPWFVTLSLSNRSAWVLTVAREWVKVEARITNRWVEVKSPCNVGDLTGHATKEVLILLPFATDACRLGIKYVPEPLHLRWMRLSSNLGLWRHSWYRALARRVFPVRWLDPLRSEHTGHSPHWRLTTPQVALPQGPAPPAGVLGRTHNQSPVTPPARQPVALRVKIPPACRWCACRNPPAFSASPLRMPASL